jgi:hypothetical protein
MRLQRWYLPTQVEAQIERDLLVARPPGMKTFAEIADTLDQLALDERVDIFIGAVHKRRLAPAALEDLIQRSGDFFGFRLVEDADTREPLDPRKAPRHVVFEETAIESEGGSELERNRIGLAAETS